MQKIRFARLGSCAALRSPNRMNAVHIVLSVKMSANEQKIVRSIRRSWSDIRPFENCINMYVLSSHFRININAFTILSGAWVASRVIYCLERKRMAANGRRNRRERVNNRNAHTRSLRVQMHSKFRTILYNDDAMRLGLISEKSFKRKKKRTPALCRKAPSWKIAEGDWHRMEKNIQNKFRWEATHVIP